MKRANSENERILRKRFSSMKQRCYNPKSPIYKWYGGKGITICDEWMNGEDGILAFLSWSMNHKFKPELSIDRIDSSKGYSPENCRWISRSFNSSLAQFNAWEKRKMDSKI